MTPAMLNKARANAAQLRLEHVELHRGYEEELPVEAAAADVVISHRVINLSPDKETRAREA
jgi:arsenite methyltransferase